MNDITLFLNEELDICLDRIINIKEALRTIELDIESFGIALSRMSNNKDYTKDIFTSVDASVDFINQEYSSLLMEEHKFKLKRDSLKLELEKQQARFDKLRNLIELYDDGRNRALNNVGINNNSNLKYEDLFNQENDRKRIAMDIHDTVLQNLTAVTLKNELILKIFQNDPIRTKLEIDNNTALIKQSITDLRNIIYDLKPINLDNLGFKEAFNNLMDRISKKTDMEVSFEFKGDNFKEDVVIMTNIVRIVQELCVNSIKHSEATKLDVKVNAMKTRLKITVEDDGKGFDYDSVIASKEKGFGLSMVNDRIYFFKGVLKATNTGNGMKYDISIPLKRG